MRACLRVIRFPTRGWHDPLKFDNGYVGSFFIFVIASLGSGLRLIVRMGKIDIFILNTETFFHE